jgi:hypothetical protein
MIKWNNENLRRKISTEVIEKSYMDTYIISIWKWIKFENKYVCKHKIDNIIIGYIYACIY